MAFNTGISSKLVCLHNERTLLSLAGGAYPAFLNKETYGVMEAVQVAAGRNGIMSFDRNSIKPTNASCQTWEIKYKSKICRTAIEAPMGDGCGAQVPLDNDWKYANPTMSDPLVEGFRTSLDDADCECESGAVMRAENLRTVYDSLRNGENARITAQVLAGLGNYYADDCATAVSSATPATQRVVSLLDSNFKPQPLALSAVKKQYSRMGFKGDYIVIGGEGLDNYAEAKGLSTGNGCCGIDPTKGTNLNHFVDYDLDTAFGDNEQHFVTLAPGSVFYMTWTKYKGEKAIATDLVTKRSIDLGSAFGDAPYWVDHIIKIEPCGEVIDETFYRHVDASKLPDDAFNSADCGQCGNFCIGWKIGCGTDVTCPDLAASA